MHLKRTWAFLALAAMATVASAAEVIVNSNNPSGDFFTNPTTVNAGQNVIGTNWFYNNVRNDGTVGINGVYARSGLGSAYLSGVNGPGGNSSKADLEFINFSSPGNITSPLAAMGTLGALNALSYEWRRNSSSNAGAHLHPSLRMYFDADGNFGTSNDRGYLVFEGVYNGRAGTAPTDTWVFDDVFNWSGAGSSANVWMVHFGNPNGSVLEIYDRTIQEWIGTSNPNGAYPTLSAQTAIYGLSSGIGSGWGTFDGAVDNITVGFTGGSLTTYNFEPVPEPATMAVLGLGAAALLRRRRKSA